MQQDLHATIQSLHHTTTTFVSQYHLHITTGPSCHSTVFMSRQGPAKQRRRGDSNPVPLGVPPPAPFAFFWPFLLAPRRKAKPETTAFSQEKKTWPGGGGGEEEGMWILGGNRGQFEAPPGIMGSPPRTRPLFCWFFTQFRGAGGGGHEAGGAPRPIVGHRVVRCGSVRGVGGRGLALIQGAAELQFWGRFERFWGNEGKVITCCLRRGSGRVATSWKAIATPPKPPPKTADFYPRQKEKQLALPPRRRRGLSRPQSYRISVKLTQKISRRHRGCRRGSGAKHFWDALVSFW